MQPKPEAFNAFYAETFQQSQVVTNYRFRPPYPEEVFTLLSSFLVDEPRTILDIGTGSGDLSRPCTAFASRVDAVDFSQEMISLGKQLPAGDHPRLNWIYGKIEEAPLNPPYSLMMAGSSIHWPDWSLTFPRLRPMLTPNAYLFIIYHNTLPSPWENEFQQIRQQYIAKLSDTHPALINTRPIHTVTELKARGFIDVQGHKDTTPVAFQQTIDDYFQGIKSRSTIARALEHMTSQQSAEFEAQVKAVLLRYHPSGLLPLQVSASLTYCRIP